MKIEITITLSTSTENEDPQKTSEVLCAYVFHLKTQYGFALDAGFDYLHKDSPGEWMDYKEHLFVLTLEKQVKHFANALAFAKIAEGLTELFPVHPFVEGARLKLSAD